MGALKQPSRLPVIGEGGQGRPQAEAWRDRSVAVHILEGEARQGFVVVPSGAVWGNALRSISPSPGVLAGGPKSRAPVISSSELRHGVVRPQPAGLNQALGLAGMRGP